MLFTGMAGGSNTPSNNMGYTPPNQLPFLAMPDHLKLWVISRYFHLSKLAPMTTFMGWSASEIDEAIRLFSSKAFECEYEINRVSGMGGEQTVTD